MNFGNVTNFSTDAMSGVQISLGRIDSMALFASGGLQVNCGLARRMYALSGTNLLVNFGRVGYRPRKRYFGKHSRRGRLILRQLERKISELESEINSDGSCRVFEDVAKLGIELAAILT